MTTADVDLDNLDLLDDDEDENFVRIRKTHLDQVRGAAKNSTKYQREAETLRREKAVADAGLHDLTDAQRNALTALVEEPTVEALKAKAAELGFIETAPAVPEPDAADLEAIERQAAAGQGAGAPISTQVKPEDANGWPIDKLMRLNEQHPDLSELLKRGETITLPQGFA